MKMPMRLLLVVILFSTLASCSSGKRSLDTGGLFPIINKDGKWGYIDKSGKVIIQPQFVGRVQFFSEGLAGATTDGRKLGFIDKSGNFVISPQYDDALFFSDGLAAVLVDKKIGYIDRTGKFVITPQFESGGGDTRWAYPFSDGLAGVFTGDKCGYIDKSGKFVINPQFKECFPFYEKLAPIRLEDKWGGIDKTGKMVINPQFQGNYYATIDRGLMMDILVRDIARITFSDGLAAVSTGDKSGYIDTTGHFVINPQFELALPFIDGLALVAEGKGPEAQIGWIDKSGKYIWKR